MKRGLLSVAAPRTLVGPAPVVDEFGEVPARKRRARALAAAHGHQLGSWHRRKNDPAGRHNAFCFRCGRLAVVATDGAADLVSDIYGNALSDPCQR
jgi:hypothetical protein